MMAKLTGTERWIMEMAITLLIVIRVALSQPQCNSTDRTVYAQLGERVKIECRCNETEGNLPQWKINDDSPKRYDELPSRLKVEDQNLVIQVSKQSDNGTSFQCVFDIPGSQEGSIILLLLNSTVKGPLVRRNYVELKFEGININVTINRYDISCVKFIVERFTLIQLMTDNLIPPNRSFNSTTNQIIIPTQELQGFYFRAIGINKYNETCSPDRTEEIYYYFNESHNINYTVPKQKMCFPVPEGSCYPIYAIWPQNKDNSHSCICPAYENTIYPFSECAAKCDSIILAEIVDNHVCFSNLNLEMNTTSIFFECVDDLCPSDCFVHSILSSHEIIIDGPPSAPTLYTSSNDSFICFDAYSSPRHPVLHYNINVTDEKDQHLEDEVYSRNSDDTITKCHNINDLLGHYDTLEVFVSATNDIGTSNVTEKTITIPKKLDPRTIFLIKIIAGTVGSALIILLLVTVIICCCICIRKIVNRRNVTLVNINKD